MINRTQAKRYCGEDFSLIENYDKASEDLIQTWDLHHRKEDEGYSKQELKDLGLYNKRPASELIFLTHAEHTSLHNKNKSVETRRKISEAMKGNKHCLGKKHSEETRRKISKAMKGEKSPLSKQVNQIDKQTGEILKTWPCTMEVQRVLRINQSSIAACCLGKRKSAGGYIWKYADI